MHPILRPLLSLSLLMVTAVLLAVAQPAVPAAVTRAANTVTRSSAAEAPKPLDEVTYEAIVASAADRTTTRLRSQQDWYWSITAAIGTLALGFLAFLGFGQIRSLRENLNADVVRALSTSPEFQDSIANRIEDSVLRSVKESQQSIERQMDFMNIRLLAERLQNVPGFSALERDALFQGLLRLKNDSKISSKPEYMTAMEQMFSSFFQAGIWDKMDILESELREIIVTNPRLVMSLLPSLAYRIFGETETGPNTMEGFVRYISVAKQLNYAEVGYAYELPYLLTHQPDDWERRIAVILEDARDLTAAERADMVNRIERLASAENIAMAPKAYHHRIAEKFAKVLAEYGSKLQEIRDLPEQAKQD